MKSKKFISCTLAVMLSLGTLTALPEQLNDTFGMTITADAASDFVIDTDMDGNKYIDGYNGAGGDIVIPEDISYINSYAFEGVYKITSITAEGDLYVKNNAFQGCTRLSRVVVKGNAQFEDYAFNKCVNLEKTEVSGSIDTTIGKNAFANCTSLRTFKVKGSELVYTIGKRAFFNCINLTTVTIPGGCSQINDEAFLNCPSLGSLTIPAKTKISSNSRPFGYTIGMLASEVEKPKTNYTFELDFDLDDMTDKIYDKYFNGLFSWKYVFNNGTTPMYVDYFSSDILTGGTSWSYFYESDYYKLYGIHDRVSPRKIKLEVVKGSNAETFAKKNNIEYSYYTEKAPVKKLASPENIKASAKTQNSITLKWDKVAGADAYKVYMYNSKTGKYEEYKTVTSNSCTIKKLKKNTKYKFKVSALDKADGKYNEGEKSVPVAVTTKKK